MAVGAAFAGVSVRFGSSDAPKKGKGKATPRFDMSMIKDATVGRKRAFPLRPFERPSLGISRASRAIPIQNVDLTPGTGIEYKEPVWSPNGSKILFVSNGEDSTDDGINRIDKARTDGTYHIWMMNPDGSNQVPVAPAANNQRQPTWSPNGRWIAYSSNEEGDYDIYIYTPSTDQKRKLASPGDSNESWPTFDSGGFTIAFESDRSGQSKIWSVRTDDTALTMLSTEGPSADTCPAWSPKGDLIAFQSTGLDADKDGRIESAGPQTHIWTMPYAGRQQQRQITAFQLKTGSVVNKEPSWSKDSQYLYFASNRRDSKGSGWDTTGTFDIYRIPATQPETATTSVAAQITQRSAAEPNAPTGDEEHPHLYPNPEAGASKNPKVVYSENQNGTRHIWITSVEDAAQPRLVALPNVKDRRSIPGGKVTITAAVSDQESGVRAVYAQIRDPDDSQTDAVGLDHKVYHVASSAAGPRTAPIDVWTEVDAHMVHAQNLSYMIPPYQPPMDDFYTAADLPPSEGWLRLYDDGSHGDGAAADGVYGNTWTTPTTPSDYYLDIIAYDNAGNWKIYDGVWGFTTQQFSSSVNRGMLLVMDYAHGQKFMRGDDARYTVGANYWPTWFPTESHYTRNPTGMSMDVTGYVAENLINPPLLIPHEQLNAVDTFRRGNPVEDYDIWRVICRGRIPPDVLNAYAPRVVLQPDFTDPKKVTRKQVVADRGVFWASPYAGDLWYGDGTIVDADTQTKLLNFLNLGGRLVITGQDIGWAIMSTAGSSALLTKMGVNYIDDAASDTRGGGRLTVDRLKMASAGLRWGIHGEDGLYGDTGLATLCIPCSFFPYVFAGLNPSIGVDISSTRARTDAHETDTDAAGNQYWIDSIQAVAPAATMYTYSSNHGIGGNNTGVAAARSESTDTATGMTTRNAYFAFGLEGISREYPTPSDSVPTCWNRRNALVHSVICWMRTGTIAGKVLYASGKTPAENVLVTVLLGTTKVGSARTRADGTYEVEGLPNETFDMEVSLPGFTYQHAPPIKSVEAGGRTEANFIIVEAPPGSISGRVTQPDGTTPITGATVTATLTELTSKGETLEKAVQTDEFGMYTISDLPNGDYKVTASAEGFVDQTYSPNITVKPGSDTPGVNFAMGATPGGVTGKVTRASDGSVVVGALVELRAGASAVQTATTNDNGVFEFTSVPAGTYTLVVTSGSGILSTTVSVTISPNTTVTQNIVANTPTPAFVAGIVQDAAGTRITGATVEALKDGKVVKSTSTGTLQTVGGRSFNYKLAGLAAGTYDLQARKNGMRTASTRVTVTESQELYDVNFTLQALYVFSSGLALVSTPYDYSSQDAAAMLGLTASATKLARWTGTAYAIYPQPPADRFRPGAGYFMQLNQAVQITKHGTSVPTTKPFAIQVQPGWNMIGNPFPFIVNWQDTKVQVGQEVITQQEAIARDIIKSALWTYSNSQYRLLFQMAQWEGYWVKAVQPCTLLINNVANRSAKTDPFRSRKPAEDNWFLQLAVRTGGLADSDNYAGVARDAGDQYDVAADVLEAPPTRLAEWVQLTFPHRQDWAAASGEYAVDVRSPVAGEKVWEFEVSTSLQNADVSLTWPNLGQLPRRFTAVLEDIDTGQRRYLRSLGAYTFRSSADGSARHFRLRITTQAQARLAVTSLQLAPNRAGGALLSFDLSDTANVRVQIMSVSGRVVREVIAGQVRSSGRNTAVWDGRNAKGQDIARGLYLYQVEAASEDGRSVRQVRPFMYVR